MPLTSAAGATAQARRASRGRTAHVLARTGLTARGVIYLLIGWVAIEVAVEHSRHEADQSGALNLLARQSFGLILLWLLAIGFAAYALWRLSEAAFGVTGDKPGAGPRLKSLARAVVYAFFAYLTFGVIAGRKSSQSHKEQDLTARVMQHTGGQWLVGIAGLVVVIVGAVLIIEGVRRTFMKFLNLGQLSLRARRIVELLGVIGTIARGAVFALAGVLVIEAAVTHKPSKAGGIDKALLTLRGQPLGEVLLFVAALGLVIFGIYGLCEARWRKV